MASEAWESHDESSKLGLLDLEDSAEESWEECCDTALEAHDAALLLNRPLEALLVLLVLLLLSRLAVLDGAVGRDAGGGAGGGGGGGGRESTGATVLALATAGAEEASTGAGEDEAAEVEVSWADVDTDDGAASNRAIFIWGGGVPKLPSSSMKRLGVLMMRRETVLTTGMMNCRMFFSWVFLMPESTAPVPLPPIETASFSSRFCAPFLARCSSCLAMVASVRLEEGTIRTGFLWRGLFLMHTALEGDEEAGGLEEYSAPSAPLGGPCWGVCGSVPLTRKALCSSHSKEVDSCAAAAAAASALSRSAEGGRPRLRLGTPGKVLSLDLRGLSLVALSLFRVVTLDSSRPPLGNLDSVSCGCPEPSGVLLAPFLSSSVSIPSSVPACLLSSPAAWLPVLQALLLLEDGGRPLLFSPVPGGLPGSLFTFSAGLSGPSAFACVGEGREDGEG